MGRWGLIGYKKLEPDILINQECQAPGDLEKRSPFFRVGREPCPILWGSFVLFYDWDIQIEAVFADGYIRGG